MTFVLAAFVSGAMFLLVTGGRPASLSDRVGLYLLVPNRTESENRVAARGVAAPWLPAAIGGGLIGALAAQGDLFLAGGGRSVPALVIVGAVGGYFVWSVRRTNAQQRKARRFQLELPVVSDAIALHVVAGDSVSSALARVAAQMHGVAIEEIRAVLALVNRGEGLAEALLEASRVTAHKDGRRLYDLLGHAHESGGRLATMLSELAVDLRAGIERGLSAEGGKRAVAAYGPVLALMVPTALLFLLYPTLLGLRELTGTQ